MTQATVGIIKSLVHTDLYKLTMGLVILLKFSNLIVTYKFVNRGRTAFPEGFAEELYKEINLMTYLQLTENEKFYLHRRCDYLDEAFPAYIDWLGDYRFNPREVHIEQNGGDLDITITGPWYRTVYWEVPLMALISALYYKMTNQKPQGDWYVRAYQKGVRLREHGIKFAEFGTRRAFSPSVQEAVLNQLHNSARSIENGGVLTGTSNVALAVKRGLPIIGTYAHELPMVLAGIVGVRNANTVTMQVWQEVYGARLGIALSDTFTTDVFLQSFNRFYAKLFDGTRQDSGSPTAYVDKMIAHYIKLRMNPLHQTVVFSDNLDVDKAIDLKSYCSGRIDCSFGIGTHLSNDVGAVPLNMVIKAHSVQVRGRDDVYYVVKFSDDPGKITGDLETAKAWGQELHLG